MISIIVPVYNVEKYVEKCIFSLIDQTFKNIEIIIVNDGSTDGSLEICDNLKAIDSRIKIINQENKGLSGARNTGIQAAKGEFLAFVDSDDWVEPNYIELLHSNLVKYDADISICEYTYKYDSESHIKDKQRYNDRRIVELDRENAIFLLILDDFVQNHTCTKMFKACLFSDLKFPRDIYFEDVYLMPYLFLKANKIIKVNLPLYNYLQRVNSITSSSKRNPKKDLDYLQSFHNQYEIFKENYGGSRLIGEVDRKMLDVFYRFKKILITEYEGYARDKYLVKLECFINENLVKFFSGRKDRIGFKYFKIYLSIHHPAVFKIYLKIKK